MNPYWLQITDLKYFWKILTHQNPQARWIYFINVPLCSDFSKLVGFGGSLFYRDIWDLWSVANTDSSIKGPQDSEKMLVTYYSVLLHHFVLLPSVGTFECLMNIKKWASTSGENEAYRFTLVMLLTHMSYNASDFPQKNLYKCKHSFPPTSQYVCVCANIRRLSCNWVCPFMTQYDPQDELPGTKLLNRVNLQIKQTNLVEYFFASFSRISLFWMCGKAEFESVWVAIKIMPVRIILRMVGVWNTLSLKGCGAQ